MSVIDLPKFLSASTSPCVDVAGTRAYSTSARVPAANSAPGMALTLEKISPLPFGVSDIIRRSPGGRFCPTLPERQRGVVSETGTCVTGGESAATSLPDVVEIPEFLTSAIRQTQHASDGYTLRTAGLAVLRGGVTEHRERRSETENNDLPHDELRNHRVGIKPELAGTVIPIAHANNVATGESAC